MRSRVCIAAALLLALAGCSGNDDPDARPSDEPASSATSSGTSDPSGSATTDDPGVEPADGPSVTGHFVTYHLPGGRKWDQLAGGSAFWYDPKTGGTWSISLAETREPNVSHTIDDIGGIRLDVGSDTYSGLRRVDDRTVDGKEGWVLESDGKKTGGLPVFYYEFGTVPDGKSYVYLKFEFPKDTVQTREAIESVLASVRWRS